MTRHFFFVLLFPPALMDLLLVRAHPTNPTRYFLAGYAVAAMPALVIALTDELLQSASAPRRATWCGLMGLLLSPVSMMLASKADLLMGLQAAACGGVAAFLCATAFHQFGQVCRRPARQASEPVVATADVGTATA